MRRLAALALLTACDHAPGRTPGAPDPTAAVTISVPPATPARGSASAEASASAPASTAIPPQFLGTYAVAEGEAGKPSRLVLVEVGEKGAGVPRTVLSSPGDPIDGVAFSVDGATLVVVTSKPGTTADKASQTVFAIPREGGSRRKLARCGYQCVVLGVGRDGEVWFVDQSTPSLIGNLRHVPLKGGPVVKWPHAFADCALGGLVSPDGRTLVLAVTNALGWPDCIASGTQGFYLVPIADKARRDALPPRTTCFPSQKKATEINLGVDPIVFDPPDRFAFGGGDSWEDGGAAPDVFWSCQLDGAGERRLSRLPPHVAQRTLDGNEWLAATATAAQQPDEKPIPLAGPFTGIRAFALHPRD